MTPPKPRDRLSTDRAYVSEFSRSRILAHLQYHINNKYVAAIPDRRYSIYRQSPLKAVIDGTAARGARASVAVQRKEYNFTVQGYSVESRTYQTMQQRTVYLGTYTLSDGK